MPVALFEHVMPAAELAEWEAYLQRRHQIDVMTRGDNPMAYEDAYAEVWKVSEADE